MAGTATYSNRKTILCVDDDPTLLSLEKKILTAKGYDVLQAYHGGTALEVLENNDVALIITGIKMGAMDGDEMLNILHQQSSAIPVIVITAYVTIATAVKCGKLGVYDFMAKPFKIDELLLATRHALAYGAGSDELPTPEFEEAKHHKTKHLKRFLRLKEAEYIKTKGKTVLVIDDDTTTLKLIHNLLNEVYNVLVALDGEMGLKMLEANPVDLVLTGVEMPGLGGIDVLESIRKKDENLPVLLFSECRSLESALRGIRLGAYDYIEKPLDPKILRNAIKYALLYTAVIKKEDNAVAESLFDESEQHRWRHFKQFLGQQDNAQVVAALEELDVNVSLADLLVKKGDSSFLEEFMDSLTTVADGL